MQELLNSLSVNLGWILGTILFFLAILGSLKMAANRYKKVPPSKVGIIYGRKQTYEITGPDGQSRQEKLGFRFLTGGGAVVYPFVEDYAEMDLSARLIQLEVRKIPTQGGVMVNAKGTATVMIGTDTPSLITAARSFEGKRGEEVNQIIRENLEGQLRSILGTLSIEDLISDREKLNKAVLKEAETELLKLGLRISILTIQEINDEVGYIESLGKKRTAEVQGEATKGEAEARSRAAIAASNATKEAELVAAQNEVIMAEAQKKRDVQVALFKAETEREQATANQAGAIAAAEADKTVRQRKVEAEAAETTARIQLADQETARVEKELQFKVIKPAEAEKLAVSIRAEGVKNGAIIKANQEKEAAVIKADAEKTAAVLSAEAIRTTATAQAEAARQTGQGEADALKAKQLAAAEGTKAQQLADATGIEAKKKAEAAGQEAMLLANARGVREQKLAEAAGTEAALMAEARGSEAKLLAEAKGKKELALALAALDPTGKLLQILDAAPKVAEAIGDALAKALGPDGLANVFGQMAAPLGSVDSIRMYDFGGNGQGGNGAGPLAKFANLTPDMFFEFVSKVKALGFGSLLEKFGLTSDILDGMISTPPTEGQPPAVSENK